MPSLEQLKINGPLPSPKGVALAIMEISRRDDATTAEIARVVQTDPALSGRLLQLVNAAANKVTHGQRPIASVPEAVLCLGLGVVRNLALGFSLVDQYQDGLCQGFDYPRFWSHSLFMAVASRELASHSQTGSADELFVCGLMAHIGCLALAMAYPVEYAELLAGQGGCKVEVERQVLGIDHNQCTAAMLADFGLPKALSEPVFFHETPGESGFSEGSRPYQIVHLLYLAKRMADLGLAQEPERPESISELMLLGGKVGLDAVEFGDLFDRVVVKWHEWGQLLKVTAQALPAFVEMSKAPAPKPEDTSLEPALRVLLIEDEASSRLMMQEVLGMMLGHQLHAARNGEEGLTMALEVMPQVVVTDWMMPVMDGLEFCRALRATEWGQSMYVIMLTGVDSEEEIVRAFEAGVDDYVTKPINLRSLRARMRAALHYVKLLEAWERDRARLKQFAAELAISNRKLEHTAMTDLLTGLPNRRAGMGALNQAWSAAARSGQPLSVMVIDIDWFKRVNDQYGHAVGDKVLEEMAKAFRNVARKGDFICRMGGEEFLVVCQNADLKSSVSAAERLRRSVRAQRIKIGNVEIEISVSVGVATREAEMTDVEQMVIAADKALYAAKGAGRNRTCLLNQGKVLCGNS